MSEQPMTPFVLAFGTALRDVPDPCPWCGAAREYHPTSGGSNRTHPDGCAFFAIHHEHDKAVAALSARVAKLEAALAFYGEVKSWTDYDDNALSSIEKDGGDKARAALEDPK